MSEVMEQTPLVPESVPPTPEPVILEVDAPWLTTHPWDGNPLPVSEGPWDGNPSPRDEETPWDGNAVGLAPEAAPPAGETRVELVGVEVRALFAVVVDGHSVEPKTAITPFATLKDYEARGLDCVQQAWDSLKANPGQG